VRFAIAGPVARDHIILPAGDRREKYGAVTYAATAMARLLEGTRDEVFCLSHVAPADYPAVAALLDHPNIDRSGLVAMEGGGTEIELTYVNEHERMSRQVRVMPPLTVTEMDRLAGCRAVLLMPLNDTDIPLAGVQKLRADNDAVLFLDIHGLVTGVDESGRRFGKPWADAEAWLACLDIVKMNGDEAHRVAGRSMRDYEEYARFAARLLRAGPETCWITFGDRSSLLAWRREERIEWASVPVVTDLGPVVDTTGCGDASSAGFVYAYVKGYRHPIRSVIMGNTIGSLKATFGETDAFPPRPEISGVIGDHYRQYLHRLLDDFLDRSRLIVRELDRYAD